MMRWLSILVLLGGGAWGFVGPAGFNYKSKSTKTPLSMLDKRPPGTGEQGTDTWVERDSTWLTEANTIEYVVGGASNSFGSLESIGLNISSEISSRNIIPHHLTTASDLFCNRELNMEQIDAVGFDMDWTLAQYNEDFDLLAFNGAKEKLVSMLGYPAEVEAFVYTQDFCRRGCIVDKKRGNVLKLDQHNYVRVAEHGLTALTSEERKSVYRQKYHEMNAFSGSNFANIDTPFSLVDATLFVQMVDLRDRYVAASERDPSGREAASGLCEKTYLQLWTDMRQCVDRCHKDGVIKQVCGEELATSTSFMKGLRIFTLAPSHSPTPSLSPTSPFLFPAVPRLWPRTPTSTSRTIPTVS